MSKKRNLQKQYDNNWGGKRFPAGGRPRIDEKASRNRISLTLPPKVIEWLDSEANTLKKSRSQLIIDIVQKYREL